MHIVLTTEQWHNKTQKEKEEFFNKYVWLSTSNPEWAELEEDYKNYLDAKTKCQEHTDLILPS